MTPNDLAYLQQLRTIADMRARAEHQEMIVAEVRAKHLGIVVNRSVVTRPDGRALKVVNLRCPKLDPNKLETSEVPALLLVLEDGSEVECRRAVHD